MSTLPTSRDFVTQLLNSLPSRSRTNAESNPLNDAPESVKKQLLSLQVLFPNEFLPALDLLDRRLITRFRIGSEEQDSTNTANAATSPTVAPDVQMDANDEPLNNATDPTSHEQSPPDIQSQPQTLDTGDSLHYVRSAQQRSSRFSTSYDSTTSYEVRLRVWNCTCPAFAFAAFPSVHPEPPVPTYTPAQDMGFREEDVEAEEKKTLEWIFGGVTLGEGMPPLCKHLLACVLAERCKGVFGECVEERRVSVETAAGWAAGWGDL